MTMYSINSVCPPFEENAGDYEAFHPVPRQEKPRAAAAFTQAMQNPFLFGGAAGFTESLTMYWTATWKYCRQQNLPLPTSVKGFYKGFTLNAVCMSLFFGVMNGVNESVRKGQEQKRAPDDQSWLATFAPAVFGGAAATTLLNPVEVATSQRLEHKEPSLTATIKRIYAKQGWKGFYTAFPLALARNIPYSMAVTYAGPKAREFMDTHFSGTWGMYAAVGMAGFVSGVLTQAVDNVKTQVQRGKDNSCTTAFKRLYKQGGYRALLSGMVPRVVRTTCGSMVAFAVLQQMEKKL